MIATPTPQAPASVGWPFTVTAVLRDGARRTLTVYGQGETYRAQLADGVEQARQHPTLQGAAEIHVR